MNQKKIGGTKRKVQNVIAMAVLIVIFIAYMFPFLMVLINSLKQKRDIGYIARYVIVKLELKLEMRRDLSRIYFVYQNAINRVKK